MIPTRPRDEAADAKSSSRSSHRMVVVLPVGERIVEMAEKTNLSSGVSVVRIGICVEESQTPHVTGQTRTTFGTMVQYVFASAHVRSIIMPPYEAPSASRSSLSTHSDIVLFVIGLEVDEGDVYSD